MNMHSPKIKKSDEKKQKLYRGILEAYNENGVNAARKAYQELSESGWTYDSAVDFVELIKTFLNENMITKVRKGSVDVDVSMDILTLTPMEEREIEIEMSEVEIRYIKKRNTESIDEYKKSGLRTINSMMIELEYIQKRFEASIDNENIIPDSTNLTSRSRDLDDVITKMNERNTANEDIKRLLELIETLTGMNYDKKE